jgi:hypothetical protein
MISKPSSLVFKPGVLLPIERILHEQAWGILYIVIDHKYFTGGSWPLWNVS